MTSDSGRAVRSDFDPSQLATAADPYALLAEARQRGAVQRGESHWLVFGYAAAEQVLRSPSGRSGFIAEFYRAVLPAGAVRDEFSHRINFLDPPHHQRVRRIIAKAFTPRRIAAVQPFVAETSRALLRQLGARREFDLYGDFAHQVPALVISELLGVPPEDRERLTRLSDDVAKLLGLLGLTEDRLREGVAAAEEMHEYLDALVAERRRDPRDDLLTALVEAEDDDQRLSEGELLSLAATLYSAGHRTTSDLFSNGTAALLADQEIWAMAVRGEIPIDAVISEYLRYETPTHYVARMMTEPLEVAGVTIAANEPVLVLLAAANRDPAAYERPERFDPTRWSTGFEPPAPLSFALGAHYCLGANLARLEAEEMLRALIEVVPAARLATDELRWRHTGLFRGLEELPIRS